MRNRERGLSLFFCHAACLRPFYRLLGRENGDRRASRMESGARGTGYLTQWPENAFTEKIIPPQAGAVDYALDDTASGRYAIFIKDISSKESEQYVKELKDSGYAELHASANEVSVGTMLEGEDAYLSVSYAEGVLGVVITLKEAAKSA